MKSLLLSSLRARTQTDIRFIKKVFNSSEIKKLDWNELEDISERVFKTSTLFEKAEAKKLVDSKEKGLSKKALIIKKTDFESHPDGSMTIPKIIGSISASTGRNTLDERAKEIISEINEFNDLKKSTEHTIAILQTHWKDCWITSEIEENSADPSEVTVVFLDLGDELFSSTAPNGETISMLPKDAKYHKSLMKPPAAGLYILVGAIIDGDFKDIYADADRDVDRTAVISNLTKNFNFKTIELTLYDGPKTISG